MANTDPTDGDDEHEFANTVGGTREGYVNAQTVRDASGGDR